jgi:signal transduction histidine kinase
LRVRDTGVGISADDLPHVFDRFYRADRARTSHAGGAGLGLAIAKAIVEAHQGLIGCQSRVGEGTEVVVRLPRAV